MDRSHVIGCEKYFVIYSLVDLEENVVTHLSFVKI